MTASSKYRNEKTVVDGVTFDSKKEAARYQELVLLERAGEIENLELQPVVRFEVGGVKIRYDSGRQAYYRGDFKYFCTKQKKTVIEDPKGCRTRHYRLKKAILRAMGIDIVES
jgi:hypothetical protein